MTDNQLLNITGEIIAITEPETVYKRDEPVEFIGFILKYDTSRYQNEIFFFVKAERLTNKVGDVVTVQFSINAVPNSKKPGRFVNILHVVKLTTKK